jgi:hypothetical protein
MKGFLSKEKLETVGVKECLQSSINLFLSSYPKTYEKKK